MSLVLPESKPAVAAKRYKGSCPQSSDREVATATYLFFTDWTDS